MKLDLSLMKCTLDRFKPARHGYNLVDISNRKTIPFTLLTSSNGQHALQRTRGKSARFA
jgi:hypothetical protein